MKGRIGRLVVLTCGIGAVAAAGCSSVTEPSEALGAPSFVDETAVAGVDHVYSGGSRFFEGGGVAVFDCDGDELPELYFAGGENSAALYGNRSAVGGELAFERIESAELGLDSVAGAYPIDVDSDGITDLAVLRLGENILFRGKGDCAFERANEIWGFDGGNEWTVGFSATWEEGSDRPTLAFANYLKLTDLRNETDLCAANALVRPEGDRYGDPILLEPGWCSLSVLFSDWDRDGEADLRVTNDRQYNRDGEELLWRISGEEPVAYTREEGWKLVRIWGMGIASHDVTGDGYPDVYLTSQGDNRLQTLADGPGRPTYTDIAIRRGVTAHRPYVGDNTLPSTAWHPEFQDVNNDGFIDLFVSKGNVDAMPDFTDNDPNNLFLGQPDGTFVDGGVDAGIVHGGRTRGSAVVDLNLDGMVDLVEVNRVENARVWRNVGSGSGDAPAQMGNWVDVRLDLPGVNRRGVGSWIEMRIGGHTMSREVTIGGGHASGSLGWHHFGLGPSGKAEVRVIWPNGREGRWLTVDAGQRVTVVHGDPDELVVWEPPP
ncbi:MAG: CRTAC1 family protein [Actinomycetota bacterium]